MPITLDRIETARAAIARHVVLTRCTRSRTLSGIVGAEVWLKFENLQFTASFKERGALFCLQELGPRERERGVVAASAGNHAQAVAHHAGRLGIPATIVMPRHTPNVKVERTAATGAEVLLRGEDFRACASFAEEIARERGLHRIHAYDDADVICGQGTVCLEILEQVPDLDLLVVPVGGGGLVAGCATVAAARRPELEVIGVQCARYAAMKQALGGEPIRCGGSTIAEGVAVSTPGSLTLPIIERHVSEILVVDEPVIEEAVRLLLEVEKTVVEGAGAVGLAALLQNRGRFEGRRIGVILSGGNIDLLALSSIIQRGLARSGRLARLRVELMDSPGALAEVCRCLGEAEANVVEVSHQRAFTNVPLKSADVQFVLQTRGLDHMRSILEALGEAGYAAHWLEPDTQMR